jgi:hypothetical protein
MSPDYTTALQLLHDHATARVAVAAALADQAEAAWQEWIDAPAFARREQPQIGDDLHALAVAARKVADDAATLRPKFCTVEILPAGCVRLLVGQA